MKALVNNKIDFDQEIAWEHLNKLVRFYKIDIYKWSVTNCGLAYQKTKNRPARIKIPKPTNILRFCIALHEVGHIARGVKGPNYITEYNAEMFAISEAQKLGFDTSEYEEDARFYIIMNINKAFRRKLNLSKIPKEIQDFCKVDFSKWENKDIWVNRKDRKITIL